MKTFYFPDQLVESAVVDIRKSLTPSRSLLLDTVLDRLLQPAPAIVEYRETPGDPALVETLEANLAEERRKAQAMDRSVRCALGVDVDAYDPFADDGLGNDRTIPLDLLAGRVRRELDVANDQAVETEQRVRAVEAAYRELIQALGCEASNRPVAVETAKSLLADLERERTRTTELRLELEMLETRLDAGQNLLHERAGRVEDLKSVWRDVVKALGLPAEVFCEDVLVEIDRLKKGAQTPSAAPVSPVAAELLPVIEPAVTEPPIVEETPATEPSANGAPVPAPGVNAGMIDSLVAGIPNISDFTGELAANYVVAVVDPKCDNLGKRIGVKDVRVLRLLNQHLRGRAQAYAEMNEWDKAYFIERLRFVVGGGK